MSISQEFIEIVGYVKTGDVFVFDQTEISVLGAPLDFVLTVNWWGTFKVPSALRIRLKKLGKTEKEKKILLFFKQSEFPQPKVCKTVSKI